MHPARRAELTHHAGHRYALNKCLLGTSKGGLKPSMSTKPKTNAMRVLERAGIPFQIREYELDEEHFSAERVAALVGMAPETVFKTLIAHGDKTGYLFAMIPASTELDLRTLAAASGNKRVELASLRDVLELTGYMRGAVTPLAAKRAYRSSSTKPWNSGRRWRSAAVSAACRSCWPHPT